MKSQNEQGQNMELQIVTSYQTPLVKFFQHPRSHSAKHLDTFLLLIHVRDSTVGAENSENVDFSPFNFPSHYCTKNSKKYNFSWHQ